MCTFWVKIYKDIVQLKNFKNLQIIDLRRELECRSVSSKGLKSQLIARLTKTLKSELEKEEEQEAMEGVS